eukprot:TRINITY_DN36315_c0_g2_i1.p1 TRINITY_DN36315_c0_g2~~TRINITY_DN36315_c0_g2_i1.p1  ORF type:complete len:250 (+),score=51.43 TRINITY_DN36315_c0_g2_i1:97-846(+)
MCIRDRVSTQSTGNHRRSMGKESNGSPETVPGDFDVYLLAQTWNPQFCCDNPSKCCVVKGTYATTHLSLHGLWPGWVQPRGSYTWPQFCRTSHKAIKEHVPLAAFDLAPAYRGELWKHEWDKHGTCSSLGAAIYFAEAMRTMLSLPGKGTPELLVQNIGRDVSSSNLRAQYPRQVGIRTDRNGNLQEITTCFQKLSNGQVGLQVDCPLHVLQSALNNCRSAQLHVPAFDQCAVKHRQNYKQIKKILEKH